MPLFLLLLATLSATSHAAFLTQGIPRVATGHFVREGLYEGGDGAKANVEALRLASHPGGVERWVVDFSDTAGRTLGKVAPRFLLRYEPAEPGVRAFSRFLFSFRAIQSVYVTREQLARLAKKSRFVKEVVLYPAVEDGDIALELVLRSRVRFETHQPLEKAGRLVLDLKSAP